MKSTVSLTLQCSGFLSSGRGLHGGREKWVEETEMDSGVMGGQVMERGEVHGRDRDAPDVPRETG